MAKDCQKPIVEISKGLCYECGKPGHVARDCRSKGSRGGTAPVRMVDEEESFFGCVECDGWQVTARKPKTATRPTPSSATLGDFVPTKISNKFDLLTEDDVKPLSRKQRKRQAMLIKDIVKAEDEMKRDKNAVKRDRQAMVVNKEPNERDKKEHTKSQQKDAGDTKVGRDVEANKKASQGPSRPGQAAHSRPGTGGNATPPFPAGNGGERHPFPAGTGHPFPAGNGPTTLIGEAFTNRK